MRFNLLALAVLVIAVAPVPARVESPTEGATAADVTGNALRRIARNPDRWAPLGKGDLVPADSAVQTGANSAVLLSLPGQHVIRIGESTTLEIKEAGRNRSYSFALLKGRIWSYVNKAAKPAKYEVETSSVILGVSGTLFSVARDDQTDEVDASVEDGQVRMRRGPVQKILDHGFQLRVVNRRLVFATPRRQTTATQAMWKAVGTAETWSRPGGALRLNRQIDERARAVVQERKHEKAATGRGHGPAHGRGRGGRG